MARLPKEKLDLLKNPSPKVQWVPRPEQQTKSRDLRDGKPLLREMARRGQPQCGKEARPRLEHSIPEGSPLAKEKLASLGVPSFDIVRVANDKSEQVFLLARVMYKAVLGLHFTRQEQKKRGQLAIF